MLRSIKNNLERLCYDAMEEIPEDVSERITDIRKQMIYDDGWIKDNEHLRLKALQCLWDANLPSKSFYDVRWQINRADGWLEEAIRIDSAERLKGVPKPLKVANSLEQGTDRWINENLLDDLDGYMSPNDIHLRYEMWMEKEFPDAEPLNMKALCMRLSKDGFEKTSKWIDGKTERVWKVSFKN